MWFLEKVVVDGVDHFPPINFETSDVILYFPDTNTLSTNVCNVGFGTVAFSGYNFSLTDGFSITLTTCFYDINIPFENLYLFDFFLINSTNNFSYNISTGIDGFEMLTITNFQNDIAVYKNITLSKPSLEKTRWSFHPNPTKDFLTFKNENITPSKVDIYDNLGKLCISKTIDHKNNTIAVDGLSNGIYYIKISNEMDTFSSKFIKE